MSAVERRPGAQIARLADGQITVEGTLAEIDAVLAPLRAAGRLGGTSRPAPAALPSVYMLHARVLPPARPLVPAPTSWWTPRRQLAAGAVLAVLLAAMLWALVIAVKAFLAWLMANLLPIVGLVAVAGWLARNLIGSACRTIIEITHRH